MSKLRRRQEPCTICGLKPAPFRMTEQKGKTITNKGRICVACLQTWRGLITKRGTLTVKGRKAAAALANFSALRMR
jgi:hypothetical protein